MLRVVRACAVAVCVVAVSLAGHIAAGGELPGAWTLVGSSAVVSGYAGVLTGGRVRVGELVAALGAGQVLLHLAFMTPGGTHSGGAAMVAGHAVATLVLAFLLAHGESAAWSLWCWLRPRVVVPRTESGGPLGRVECLSVTASARAQIIWLGSPLSVRGPPVATGSNH